MGSPIGQDLTHKVNAMILNAEQMELDLKKLPAGVYTLNIGSLVKTIIVNK